MKINTPLRFTFLCALISSATLVICFYLFGKLFYDNVLQLVDYLLLFLVLFLVSGLTIYFLLDVFISSKIRLLYRMMQNTRLSSPKSPINMKEDVLIAAEEEVLNWAKENREEIVRLKKEEEFRKEFIGNLAHELKTPIFSIQGYILTLLEGGLTDENVNLKFLNRALKGVERMDRIISDLDMITNFESEKMELDLQENDIVEICKEIYESLELKAREQKVSLKFAKSYKKPIMVKCDKSKIGQVMQNLVNNAINYSGPKCKVVIRFINVDSNLLIEVEDNGQGIDTEHLSRLFERFYRVDKSRARNIGGTGLGLSIVKHIVEAHNHAVQVRSNIGKGSTFFFTLTKV